MRSEDGKVGSEWTCQGEGDGCVGALLGGEVEMWSEWVVVG